MIALSGVAVALFLLGAHVDKLSFMRFPFGILCTLIGAAFAYFKWSEAVNVRRNELLRDLIDDFASKGHEETFYKYIERYCPWFYDDGKLMFFDGAEKYIDRMLLFFNHVLYLKHAGVLTEQETVWFEYYIESVVSDCQVCQYLDDLSEFCEKEGRRYPFEWLKLFATERSSSLLLPPADAEEVLVGEPCTSNSYRDGEIRLKEWMFKKGTRLRTARSILARIRALNKVVDLGGITKGVSEGRVNRILAEIEKNPNRAVVSSWRSAFGKYYYANTGDEPSFLNGGNKSTQRDLASGDAENVGGIDR